jgi:hypothetical protein
MALFGHLRVVAIHGLVLRMAGLFCRVLPMQDRSGAYGPQSMMGNYGMNMGQGPYSVGDPMQQLKQQQLQACEG